MLSFGNGLKPLKKKNTRDILLGVNNNLTKLKQRNTGDNVIIESIHPPEAKIDKDINGTLVRVSPFKTNTNDKGTLIDIRKIMESNNNTDIFLKLLGDQLNRVEEVIQNQEDIKKKIIKKDNKPLFKLFKLSRKFQENHTKI